ALSIERTSGSTPLSERAEALAALTESRLAQGKIGEATQSSAELAKLVPNAPVAQMLGARIKLAHGDRLSGIADLERLVANMPKYVEARLLLGGAQLERGDLEQAQQNLEQVVQQAPDNLQARELLASVHLKLNQPDQALGVLTPALGEHAMDAQLYSLIGTAGRRAGNPNAALQALEAAVSAHPKDRALKLNLAQAYLGANRPNDALQLLQKTDAQGEDPRRDALLIAAVNAVQGPAAAGATADQLVAAHPKDRGMLDIAAMYFASEGQYDRARALLGEALQGNPHDVPSRLALARVDSASGDAAAAESSLRTALAAQPGNLTVRLSLANALIAQRTEDSLAQARQLLEAAPRTGAGPELQFALAEVYLAGGKLQQANAALDRAIALRPGNADLVNSAGLLLLKANQYDAALARFRKATLLAPANAVFWFNAGRAQIALNQPVPARQSFEKAAQIAPRWLPAVSALALLDLREKHADRALTRVKQLLASEPGDADALGLEGEVYAAAGRFKEAETAFADALRRRPTADGAVKLFQARRAAGEKNPEEPLQQWLAQQPNDDAVRTLLGSYYLTQQALRPAAKEFEAVVRQAPRNVVALNNLAWVYGKLKDPRAESVAEQAYRLAPGQAAVADTLGWILAAKHDTQRALPLLAQAAKSDAADPDMQYHYAYILVQAGRRAEAREILAKLLAGKQGFESRADAERLYANLKS
ncbi:MAG TPA: XrtA/PEP-CTERM system TPR-repeat protein PrsT, partial [Steroidobacteraceae bacterium]|nr:XrtA/PEP-CTERM system TPR-repeat protein PrsT [Steroidobacteraceae bacterium]